MKKNIGIVSAAVVLVLGVGIGRAAQFDQDFAIREFVGQCEIAAPASSSFQPAVKGKRYAYGSTIKTGRKSSMTVQLSDGNEFRVLANALVVAAEDPKDKSSKMLKLKSGEVRVKLDPSFHKTNKFSVETATAVCGAIGCEFSVSAESSGELDAVIVLCSEGQVRLDGVGFKWTAPLDGGDGVSITTDGGREFMTIKASNGSFDILFTDAAGKVHQVSAPTGTTIRLRSEQTTSSEGKPVIRVTLTVVKPDGTPLDPVTFIVPYSAEFPAQPGAGLSGAIQSITEQFTTGTTPTPIGEGR